jgi:methylated-DNA-[protein]-cysteine S-methyltransferase
MINSIIIETSIGKLFIEETGGAITELSFIKDAALLSLSGSITPILEEARSQIISYLEGKRTDFTLPLSPKGTAFQQKVWTALLMIPYGQTISYKELAARAGNPKACRAVGMANNRNPIPIIIPCHRVIGADGKLIGYGGGLPIKEKLLTLEGAAFIPCKKD